MTKDDEGNKVVDSNISGIPLTASFFLESAEIPDKQPDDFLSSW